MKKHAIRRTLEDRAVGACYAALHDLTNHEHGRSRDDRAATIAELRAVVQAHKRKLKRVSIQPPRHANPR